MKYCLRIRIEIDSLWIVQNMGEKARIAYNPRFRDFCYLSTFI